MSVCACIKTTMGCSGQDADDCAVSAISPGVWVVSARGQARLCFGQTFPPLCQTGQNQSSMSTQLALLPPQYPTVACPVFGCCRAPPRAKHPLPASQVIQVNTRSESYKPGINASISEGPAPGDWLKIILARLLFRGVL